MSEFRLAQGGRIDRDKPIEFSFDGQTYQGFVGDSLSSALLANGVHFVGRSYKYHRPRGIMSAGSEEASALVGVDKGPGRFDPNMRAPTLELVDGLQTKPQHCWPSLQWDMGELTRLVGPVASAGFYYKTFMWPKSFWKKIYEPILRKSAGLGDAPSAADPDEYASRYAHCEILVVGGGPAGIAAALEASKNGDRVILCDQQNEFGGHLLSEPTVQIDGLSTWDWLAQKLQILHNRPNVTLLPRTTAFGYYEQNMLGLNQRLSDHLNEPPSSVPREKNWKVRAKKVVLATGAIERPLVFPNNDRPGIMLAGAAQTYLNRYGVRVGNSPALFTSHDSAYRAIFALAKIGVKIPIIVDMRKTIHPSLHAKADTFGIEVLLNHKLLKTAGRFRIKAIEVAPIAGPGKKRKIACDALLVCGGWTPSVHLFSQSRGILQWHKSIGAAIPKTFVQDATSVGACNGDFSLVAALNHAGKTQHQVSGDELTSGENFSAQTDVKKGPSFVDLQHDVVSKDIDLAVREGFHSIEHIKRYTTTGMATDQGKTSNIAGLNVAASALGKPMAQIGLTTYRPPYTPTTFGALAGFTRKHLFDVTRKSPMDNWAQQNGATFEPIGVWRRASYFAQAGENKLQAIARECIATRKSIGIFDASTLGKIEVVGPGAAHFLHRFYTNPLTNLPVGRCRYVLALGEDGFVYDDGIVARLGENKFHITTTTGGAARVFANMQDYRQTEWTDLEVWLTSTSEQWAVIALNGPKVVELLAQLVKDIDLSPKAFPHMAVRQGSIFGVPLRLFRVSFTGEMGFELNVPAHFGAGVWEQLMMAGVRHNITPYGMQALLQMRAEKGYIIVGQDTDGAQTPNDLGMGWAIGKSKSDFIGKRSLSRPDMLIKNRPQLVGLLTNDPKIVLEEGAQITAIESNRPPLKMIGHVTSSYWSEALGRSVALALVIGGSKRLGEQMFVPMVKKVHRVKLVQPVFYDPDGKRLNMEP